MLVPGKRDKASTMLRVLRPWGGGKVWWLGERDRTAPDGAPSPGPSPLVPRGEGRTLTRCDKHRTAPAGGPLPRPLPARSSRRGENSIALRLEPCASPNLPQSFLGEVRA